MIMAIRKVFYIKNNKIASNAYDIKWNGGFSLSQKSKNIDELHYLISSEFNVPKDSILEVSTKSSIEVGKILSSFNLKLEVNGVNYPLENVYQSSKVFRSTLGVIQYNEVLKTTPSKAKEVLKQQDHKTLIGYKFMDKDFPLNPPFMFYDWIYIRAVSQVLNIGDIVLRYHYYTDIEFNPTRSVNCQARSLVLYKWLIINDKLKDYLANPLKYYKNLLELI